MQSFVRSELRTKESERVLVMFMILSFSIAESVFSFPCLVAVLIKINPPEIGHVSVLLMKVSCDLQRQTIGHHV